MKAITYDRYGSPDVLELRAVDDPVPAPDEVLVRVRAASANPRDWHFLRGLPSIMRLTFGVRRPKVPGLGSDVAGVVEAIGRDVTGVAVGDEVFADVVTGGFAEQVCVAADLVARKPVSLTFEEAAAVPLAALTALQGLRDAAGVQAGQRVLIVGAGGGVGTFAVQLAHHLGAHVTGVCSAAKADLVRSLGADEVVDYTRTDVTATDERYDVVFQLAGTVSPRAYRRVLAPTGTLLVSSGESDGKWVGPIGRIAAAVVLSPFVSQRLLPFEAKRSGADLRTVAELIDAGELAPVIDRTFALPDVADAMRYLEEGHTRGKIVVTI